MPMRTAAGSPAPRPAPRPSACALRPGPSPDPPEAGVSCGRDGRTQPRALSRAARPGGLRAGPVRRGLEHHEGRPGHGCQRRRATGTDLGHADRAEEAAQAAAHLHGQGGRHAVRHRREGQRSAQHHPRAQPRSGPADPDAGHEDQAALMVGRAVTFVAALLAALALGAPAPAGAAEKPPPDLTAPSAILVEAATGDVLYERAADKRRPIASTTKLMTALLTTEHAKLSDVVPASTYIASPIES